jgi:vacuolar protein sorting-associated protein 54
VQSVVRAVSGVIETIGIVRGLVDDGHWGEALDGIDDLQVMWDGPSVPGPVSPPLAPSLQASELPSVAEEEPLDDEEEDVESGEEMSPSAGAELEIPLSRLKAFAALPSQLQTLTQEITSSLTSDLVATLKADLLERINATGSPSSDQTDVRDRLRPLIQGLVRTRNLKEGIAEWRGVVLGEVQGIVQQVFLLSLDVAWVEGVSHHSIYPCSTPERTHRRKQGLRGQLFGSIIWRHCSLSSSVG